MAHPSSSPQVFDLTIKAGRTLAPCGCSEPVGCHKCGGTGVKSEAFQLLYDMALAVADLAYAESESELAHAVMPKRGRVSN